MNDALKLVCKQIKPEVYRASVSKERYFYYISSQWSPKYLHPQELKLAKGYRNTLRKQEFLKGRYGVRQVIGADMPPLLKASRGYPLWPKGWIGSISHKKGFVVFIVQPKSVEQNKSIGIDLEEWTVPYRVVRRITNKDEIDLYHQLLQDFPFVSQKFLATLFFSIKEAAFKCFSPVIKYENFMLSDCKVMGIDLKTNKVRIEVSHQDFFAQDAQGWFQTVDLVDQMPCLVTVCEWK